MIRKRKVQPYLFIPGHILKMYEIYMRDTPQNEASQASQTENIMILITFMGRREILGRVPKRPKKGKKMIWDVMGRVPKKQSVPRN